MDMEPIVKTKRGRKPKNFQVKHIEAENIEPENIEPENDIMDQNQAYYKSLEMDIEKDIARQIAEIDRQTRLNEELKEKERQLELERQQEIKRQKDLEENQPSKEELRQRRLKFYENKKN
uniref:Uncharacterized protein n=1 Tax=viral metagenome TaxID=1070528 RepID=A0A6C0D3J8_9ZZZZ